MRRPTVSALGLSRSCGRVSQAGNSTISACGMTHAREVRSASESRPVATTAKRARGPGFAAISPAIRGARRPSAREKSVLVEASRRASANVEARERAGINRSRLTRRSVRRAAEVTDSGTTAPAWVQWPGRRRNRGAAPGTGGRRHGQAAARKRPFLRPGIGRNCASAGGCAAAARKRPPVQRWIHAVDATVCGLVLKVAHHRQHPPFGLRRRRTLTLTPARELLGSRGRNHATHKLRRALTLAPADWVADRAALEPLRALLPPHLSNSAHSLQNTRHRQTDAGAPTTLGLCHSSLRSPRTSVLVYSRSQRRGRSGSARADFVGPN